MKIYLAISPSDVPLKIANMNTTMYWNLFSFYYIKNINNYELIRKNSQGVLIDSGAFSFIQPNAKKNKKPNLDKYTKQYIDFIQETDNEKVNGYFEMDVDTIIGFDKVLEYRKQIEEVTDKVIPVWHKNRGISGFKKMCENYKYVSIPLRNSDVKQSQVKMFVDYAHSKGCRIHGLAGTKKSLLNHIPLDSVDSTSWVLSVAFCTKQGKLMDGDFVSDNNYDLRLNSYHDFMKMQKYYYEKWKWYNKD